MESRFIVRSQLGPSIWSGSSSSAGLQVVTQSTHLSKDCYPQQVLNQHHSEIWPPKQLDYRCLPLHPAQSTSHFILFTHQKRAEPRLYQCASSFQHMRLQLPLSWLRSALHWEPICLWCQHSREGSLSTRQRLK